jgi:hypothetical protein
MLTSARSAFLHCSRTTSSTSRTAVYGPVRTVVWQGSAGDCRPYADQVAFSVNCQPGGTVGGGQVTDKTSRRSPHYAQLFLRSSSDRVLTLYGQVDLICEH